MKNLGWDYGADRCSSGYGAAYHWFVYDVLTGKVDVDAEHLNSGYDGLLYYHGADLNLALDAEDPLCFAYDVVGLQYFVCGVEGYQYFVRGAVGPLYFVCEAVGPQYSGYDAVGPQYSEYDAVGPLYSEYDAVGPQCFGLCAGPH